MMYSQEIGFKDDQSSNILMINLFTLISLSDYLTFFTT